MIINCKREVIMKTPVISCRLLRRRKASGIVIPHMYPCLIHKRSTGERLRIIFQNQHPFSPSSTIFSCIQTVQACTYDNPVIILTAQFDFSSYSVYSRFLTFMSVFGNFLHIFNQITLLPEDQVHHNGQIFQNNGQ